MTQERATPGNGEVKRRTQKILSDSYYGLLGVHPSASIREIRQAYRDLSKLYHPDTTTLPTAIATTKFHQLNEAYATLTSPERRTAYDRKIGYSSVPVIQTLPSLNRTNGRKTEYTSSAYIDATDRPLSPGEMFALFILGLTFVGCLCLAIAISLTRGDSLFQTSTIPITAPNQIAPNQISPPPIIQPPLSNPLAPIQTPPTPPLAPIQTPPTPQISAKQPNISENHSFKATTSTPQQSSPDVLTNQPTPTPQFKAPESPNSKLPNSSGTNAS